MSRAYRSAGARPKPYDPDLRVLACDECGAPVFAGDTEAAVPCPRCGTELDVPPAPKLAIPRSAEPGTESERRARLAAQLDEPWLMPESVARFANVLSTELSEARDVWAETRRRLAEDPDQPELAFELINLTGELHFASPSQTDEQLLARRALIESTAEVLTDPSLRQGMLFHLVTGASRAGDLDAARAWLELLDPASENLRADSHYRLAAAFLATAAEQWPRVGEHIETDSETIPLHVSCRGLAAVLRANALEKRGHVDAAVAILQSEIRGRHSALALVTGMVQRMPKAWRFCERSLPRAFALEYAGLAKHVPLGTSAVFYWLGAAAAFAILFALVLELPQSIRAALGVVGVAALIATLAGFGAASRRRVQLASECILVRGRVLAIRSASVNASDVLVDVVIEHDQMPPTHVTTPQIFPARLRAMKLEGCAFDGFWHPRHPSIIPKMTIHVGSDEAAKAPGISDN